MAATLIDRIEQSQLAVIRTGLIQTHGAALSCANLSDSDSGRLLELLMKELIVSQGDSSLSSSLPLPFPLPLPLPLPFFLPPEEERVLIVFLSLSRSRARSLALCLSQILGFALRLVGWCRPASKFAPQLRILTSRRSCAISSFICAARCVRTRSARRCMNGCGVTG
jgi:hypothetical protein